MKNIILLLSVFFLFAFKACVEEEIVPSEKVAPCENPSAVIMSENNLQGTVGQVANTWVINVKNNGKEVVCVPCNLPESYQILDKEIQFGASFLDIPANVRMVGQPIEIKRIY